MRIIVFFDLPTLTIADKRNYRKFRKHLIETGFLMLQESVYCKLAPNSTVADLIVEDVRKHKPDEGIVQLLKITEKQFARMEYIVGSKNTDMIDSDEKLIVI